MNSAARHAAAKTAVSRMSPTAAGSTVTLIRSPAPSSCRTNPKKRLHLAGLWRSPCPRGRSICRCPLVPPSYLTSGPDWRQLDTAAAAGRCGNISIFVSTAVSGAAEAYHRAAAEELVQARATALQGMRRAGILVVDTAAVSRLEIFRDGALLTAVVGTRTQFVDLEVEAAESTCSHESFKSSTLSYHCSNLSWNSKTSILSMSSLLSASSAPHTVAHLLCIGVP